MRAASACLHLAGVRRILRPPRQQHGPRQYVEGFSCPVRCQPPVTAIAYDTPSCPFGGRPRRLIPVAEI
jgi:hypothetical protein